MTEQDNYHTRQLLNSGTGLLEWLTGKGYPDAEACASNVARNNYARALAVLATQTSNCAALHAECCVENSLGCLTPYYKDVCNRYNKAIARRDELYAAMKICESKLSQEDVDDALNILERVSKYENWIA